MASGSRLRILSVGGNAVSAFLSWRLQATNACDVTLVWKNGFENVSQFGVTFRSQTFGNERFKPRQVVRSPEEASQIPARGSYDYVLVCVKALPDVYDLASVIESVVTPQHTCILINTSHSLGVEAAVEERFPKNVVLSLVSHANITQLGPAEFEHSGSTELWVGPANWNPEIPVSIQSDMAEALAMTLGSGQVDAKVSKNIQQQQFEAMIGPIAFHTASVLFETPNHEDLLDLPGVRALVYDTIEEVVKIAEARGCSFSPGFKEKTVESMIAPKEATSVMYQDYVSKRPMEIEVYLGAPLTIAKAANVKTPRIETLYAMLHHVNAVNQKRTSPAATPRMSGVAPPVQGHPPGPGPNGSAYGPGPGPRGPLGPPNGRGHPRGRGPSMSGPNGQYNRRPYQSGPPGPNGRGPQRRPSFEQMNGLDEFSHLVMYDPDGEEDYDHQFSPQQPMHPQYHQSQMMHPQLHGPGPMHGSGPMPRRGPRPPVEYDEEDGADYFDPMAYRGPPVDPDNVDMMSITSRRTRKAPPPNQMRGPPDMGPRRGGMFRPGMPRNRASSSRAISETIAAGENLLDNPSFAYSDNRYGAVSRDAASRTSSLTAARLDELQGGMPRRTSHSPGQPFGPGPRPGRPSMGYPPNGAVNGNMGPGQRRSPPSMSQPVPRHPPGHGNSVAPQGIEQNVGVSNLYPPKSGPQGRSLTGSASASAGSGDSGRSGQGESENSAYSSQSSLGPRGPIGVR